MSKIVAVGAVPGEFGYTQATVQEMICAMQSSATIDATGIRQIFKNSQVEHRYFVRSLESLPALGSFVDRNHIFREAGLRLACQAVREALRHAQLRPTEIDHLIVVSTTGFCVPSIDVHLMHVLEMRLTITRTPIFGWGCNGGVSGLRMAMMMAQADPTARILLVNLELCSLAYQFDDQSQKAIIAHAIFNDGATATIIEGDAVDGLQRPGPRMLAGNSRLFPETCDYMGWEQRDSGLQVILSPDIPEMVGQHAAPFAAALLAQQKIAWDDLSVVVVHPGGARVVEALQTGLPVAPEYLADTWHTLRAFGNMSSCSVIFALQSALQRGYPADSYGLLMAFGPGFAAEGLLIRW